MTPRHYITVLASVLIAASACALGSIGDLPDFDLTAKQLCDYDALVAEVRPTAEQTDKIAIFLKAMDKALVEWDRTNAEQLASLRKTHAAARKSGDVTAVCGALNRFMALAAERRGLAGVYIKLILGALDENQLVKWGGAVLNRKLVERYKRLDLDSRQQAQLRELCNARGADVAAMLKLGDSKGLARIESEVNAQVIETVLTEAQRVKLLGPRSEPGPARATKETQTFEPKPAAKPKPKPNPNQGRRNNSAKEAQRKRELEARKREEARRRKEAQDRQRKHDERRRREARARRYRREYQRRKAAEAAAKKNSNTAKNNKKPAARKPKAGGPQKKPSGKQ